MKLFSWIINQDIWLATWSKWSPDAIVMAEKYDKVAFCLHGDAGENLWERGDLFAGPDNAHVSWQQLGCHVRVVVAAEEVPMPVASWGIPEATIDLTDTEKDAFAITLWGVKSTDDDPYWIELYIPHIMQGPQHHPAETALPPSGKAARRLLEVEAYSDKVTGENVYLRFAGIRYTLSNEEGHDLENFNEDHRLPQFQKR